MNNAMAWLARQTGCSLLAARLVMGSILIASGYNKFFVAGIDKVTGNFTGYGIPLPAVAAPFIGALELVGGVLLAIGLFTRYLGVLYFFEFIVAWYVKFAVIPAPIGGYAGARLDSMIIVMAFLFATHGAGKYSVDAKRGM